MDLIQCRDTILLDRRTIIRLKFRTEEGEHAEKCRQNQLSHRNLISNRIHELKLLSLNVIDAKIEQGQRGGLPWP